MDTPDFIKILISLAAAVTGFMVIWRVRRTSRARVVPLSILPATQGLSVVVQNVGAEAAVDITVSIDGDELFLVGLAAGGQWRHDFATPPRDPAPLTIMFFLADGGKRMEPYSLFTMGNVWRLGR